MTLTVIYGVTLISETPWTDEQNTAVHCACREVLQALTPEQLFSEEDVTFYWQSHLEKPYSSIVSGRVCPYSAYWQTVDDIEGKEIHLLENYFEKYCVPLGMRITGHFSC